MGWIFLGLVVCFVVWVAALARGEPFWILTRFTRAFTVFPCVFVPHDRWQRRGWARIRRHELQHWREQRTWALCSFGLGLFAWLFLYLFCLPVGWNPFRYRAEWRAILAECPVQRSNWGTIPYRYIHSQIRKGWFLWWHRRR